jgi:hypothetical protein
MFDRREARAILREARETLRQLSRLDELHRVSATRPIVYKIKPDTLIVRPRLKYHITENARRLQRFRSHF